MAKTATIHARVDEKIKNDALEVFNALGLNVADAITLYFRQVALKNGIPFELTATKGTNLNFDKVSDYKKNDLKLVIAALPDSVDQLWVFGSAVTPYCRPDSDLDVCIVGDDISKADRKLVAHAPRHGMDLIDVTHENFDKEKDIKNSIYNEIFEKGLLVYEKGKGLVNG